MSTAARRYATAIVESAATQGEAVLEQVTRDLEEFSAMVDGSQDLRHVLLNPIFTAKERTGALGAVLARVTLSDLSRRLLILLGERNRVSLLADVARNVRRLADQRAGRVRAEIEAAAPLTAEAKELLRRALERRTGRTVEMTVTVDPKLLGGLRARVGSMVLDGTLRSQLDGLREQLLRA
jgi:F-type H+-transporting ATPase subunit delta